MFLFCLIAKPCPTRYSFKFSKTVGHFVDNFQNTFRFSFSGVYIQQSRWDLNPVTLIWEEKQRILEVVVKWQKIAKCDACYWTKARLHLSIYYIEFSEKVLSFIKSRRKFPETRRPKLSVFKDKEEHAFLFKFGPSYLRTFFAGFCKTSMVY